MSVQILEKNDSYTIATWGRVMLLIWQSRSTAQGLDALQAHLRAWAKSSAVVLNVVPPQPARPPDQATRDAMDRAARNPVPGVLGVATLYEGGGFIGASIRLLVSRLRLLRTGEAMRFFRNTDEAALWAAQTLGAPSLRGDSLAAALREARER